jgi:2-hydroxycyclohexanecarboxyl-CoA dehydrogenase
MIMTNRIDNRAAIVTGGAAGIGAAISRFLARDGANVAIWDRNIDSAQSLVDEIRAMGRSAIACKVDVSRRSDIEAAVQAVRQALGPVGILVNNAGISPERDFVDITEEEWDTVMNVNLKGTFFCTQAVIGDMINAKWGRIINISSSSAQSGARRMVHYAATKGGVIAFTKSLAQEVGAFGITVNNVPPSFVYTAGLQSVEDRFPDGLEGYMKRTIPVQRIGQPDDIANAVAFLASEASGYITGLTLSVNGGRYMA